MEIEESAAASLEEQSGVVRQKLFGKSLCVS